MQRLLDAQEWAGQAVKGTMRTEGMFPTLHTAHRSLSTRIASSRVAGHVDLQSARSAQASGWKQGTVPSRGRQRRTRIYSMDTTSFSTLRPLPYNESIPNDNARPTIPAMAWTIPHDNQRRQQAAQEAEDDTVCRTRRNNHEDARLRLQHTIEDFDGGIASRPPHTAPVPTFEHPRSPIYGQLALLWSRQIDVHSPETTTARPYLLTLATCSTAKRRLPPSSCCGQQLSSSTTSINPSSVWSALDFSSSGAIRFGVQNFTPLTSTVPRQHQDTGHLHDSTATIKVDNRRIFPLHKEHDTMRESASSVPLEGNGGQDRAN
ncbi:hypothetical protein Hypma_013400 [Hypsizygus marmoreus]|uniref:Uncharacterized protein n=1 Tax=Hypsizygus marmoreus TaxID=39966 RepID=A0A369JJJ8_HYPMA|nr:hypothetical protein Hypma_013400 [Hypsizygus marmoreus]